MRICFSSESNATHFQYDLEDETGIEVLRRGFEVEVLAQDLSQDEYFRVCSIADAYGGQIVEA